VSSEGEGRRSRFPLTLKDTQPTRRHLVSRSDPLRPQSDARPTQPAGLGLDSDVVRRRLVDRLRLQGCTDEAVLAAMAAVPRHLFVDPALAGQAYEDMSLPIGHGQTISKPSVVARMLALLCAGPHGGQLRRVLEIGTGCGYQTALLAQLARQVYSVERLRALYDRARSTLAPIRADNLCLIYGDGHHGHGPHAPYDGIIVAAAGLDLPQPWLDQLAPLGRLVAPVVDARSGSQLLVIVDKGADGTLTRRSLEAVRFVPLESGTDPTVRS
jgi:protein-L-isoaspartate(D-aspartate) O-methyltransferase